MIKTIKAVLIPFLQRLHTQLAVLARMLWLCRAITTSLVVVIVSIQQLVTDFELLKLLALS